MTDVGSLWLATGVAISCFLMFLIALGALRIARRTARRPTDTGDQGWERGRDEALSKLGRLIALALLASIAASILAGICAWRQFRYASHLTSMRDAGENLDAATPWADEVYNEGVLQYAVTMAFSYGFAAVPYFHDQAQLPGAVVVQVWPRSPASDAGLRRGDVIERVRRRGQWVAATPAELRDMARRSDVLDVLVQRSGSRLDVRLTKMYSQDELQASWY